MLHQLENSAMTYAWGSPDGLSRLLDLPNPTGGPLAELWMGAHPKAPSQLLLPEGRRALDEFIRSKPEEALGKPCIERFGGQLPFLFKALSAAKPLSIQVHPAKRKAERGFAKENRAGVPADDPDRNYRDANHKPELSVALTDFEALCGFRPVGQIIPLMRDLMPSGQWKPLERLGKHPDRIELSVFFYALMTLSSSERLSLVSTVAAKAATALDAGVASELELPAWRWVVKLAALWPGDIGALAPLLFNHIELAPGEGLYIAPGEPHAYLKGTALEIMANSDNVIRGGLTGKFVDIPEFISVLSFDAKTRDKVPRVAAGDGEERYPCPVGDFSLSRIEARDSGSKRTEGPEIILCGEGRFEIVAGSSRLALGRGQSAFIGACVPSWSFNGNGVIWRARPDLAYAGTEAADAAEPGA